MTYGTIKVDTVTFTNAGVDKSVTLSGLVQNPTFSGNVTVTGTLSGVTVTGTTANFTSGNFTNISGGTHTITSGVFAAGSAASPSITFTGDLNTGIYSPGADQVAISTGGSGRLFVDASGRVGVGTSSPGFPFQVKSTTNAHVAIWDNGGIPQVLGVNDAGGSAQLRLAGQILSFTGSGGAGSEHMRLDASGRLGIGTTSPGSALEVVGDTRCSGSYSTNASNFIFSYGGGSVGAVRSGLYLDGTNTVLGFYTSQLERARIDGSGRLLVGTSSYSGNATIVAQGHSGSSAGPAHVLLKLGSTSPTSESDLGYLFFSDANTSGGFGAWILGQRDGGTWTSGSSMPSRLIFSTAADGTSSPTERMRIDSAGSLIYGTSTSPGADITSGTGFYYQISTGLFYIRSNGSPVTAFNRGGNDGTLVEFKQDQITEGTISVSGTTVSYNGAHLSRWSQLPSGAERTEILRGTVFSNIDEMCEWGDEGNEQLNRMKVSDVEGDKNVSGVFQGWDDDDDTYTNDFYCAMTGDFIIRIAPGVTVERGDLLMSAGDGTAKPQDDDIIRSKTIAKVTSINVSCTYDDGSYCVPCVLMAC